MSRPATWIVVPRRTSAYSSRLKSPRRRGRRENEPEENSERESGTQEAMYPSFTVRKRDRILDAFSIKSERTRGELGLTRSRLRSTIPDVHHPTARNEITFSHARKYSNPLFPSVTRPLPSRGSWTTLRNFSTNYSLYISSFLLLFRPSPIAPCFSLAPPMPAQALYIVPANNEGIYFINTSKRKKRERERGERREVGG